MPGGKQQHRSRCDLSDAAGEPRQQSSLDSAPPIASSGARAPEISRVGSSASPSPTTPSPADRVAAHGDPVEGGQVPPSREVDLSPGSHVAAPESGAVASSAAPSATDVHRPTTRLQHGIAKPKQYTDGTMRWCMTATASSEEPAS